MACCKPFTSQQTTKIFLEPKLRSPMKGTNTLEGQLLQRNLKIPMWKKKLYIEWFNQHEVLSKIAVVEPQAAYCGFGCGFKHEIAYTIRTVINICKYLEKLYHAVDTKFITTLTDGHFCNKMEKKVLSLPVKHGGMGIIFCDIAENEYSNSRAVTALLIKLQNNNLRNFNKIHKNFKQEFWDLVKLSYGN